MPGRIQPLLILSAILLCHCQQPPEPVRDDRRPVSTARQNTQSTPTGPSVPAPQRSLATFRGQSVDAATLHPLLIEAAGSQVLLEWVMDQNVRRELARRGYTLTEEDLNRERRRMSQVLSDDDDEATRLFAELRQRRRLGPARLKVLLRTNAGLRKLVQSEVQISPAMIEREYELAYGRLYEARVLTVPTLAQARQVMQAIEEGRSFTDLVVEMSTDPSRAQGGLLSPINLADAGYPQVVRTELARLEPGRISAPIAVDQSFVLLRLERIIEQDQPPLETVEEALVRQARLRIESRLMRELARTLLSQSDPTIFDPVLRESWNRQRAELLGP